MRKLLVLMSLISTSLAFADVSYEEMMWAPTNLRPIFLDNNITSVFCGKEAIRFKGCAAAVEVFAGFQNPKWELTLSDNKFSLKESNLNSLKETNFKEYQKIQRKKLNRIEELFTPESVESLVSLYKELREKNPTPKPHEIALSLNEGLAVTYDPHMKWVPQFRYDGRNHIRQKPAMGAGIEVKNNQLTIYEVVKNNSAELAGLKVDDVIIAIDDKTVPSTLNENSITEIFNFENNQEVKLTLKRNGDIFSTKVVFSYRKPGPIIDRAVDFNGKKYVYLAMTEVPDELDAPTTCKIFNDFLKKFDSQYEGMVLDLRGNPGGPGHTAACIASSLVGADKHIYTEVDFSDITVDPIKGGFEKVFNKDIVVLVNASTASSGELIASALQFHARALILGDRTFGKAIGQIQEDYDIDRVAQLFTALKAYMPNGESYHGKGLIPDAFVYNHGLRISEREYKILREEDYALFPLKIEKSTFFEEKAPALKFPFACVNLVKVQNRMEKLADTDWQKDFQLQYALETLKCM